MSSHPDYNEEVEALLESCFFSSAFYRLCTGLEDFDGLIAYGIYKDHKRRALLEKPIKRHDASFHGIHHHLNDGQRDTLWKDAQQRLKTYADKIIEDATPSIQHDHIKTYIVKRERWQFWKGVGASCLATVVMMGLTDFGAPWLAEQSPGHMASQIDQRLAKIEENLSLSKTRNGDLGFEAIEPAAGNEPEVDGWEQLNRSCGTNSTSASSTCDEYEGPPHPAD